MTYNIPTPTPASNEPKGEVRTNGRQISQDTRSNFGRRGDVAGDSALSKPQPEKMPERTIVPNRNIEKEY